MHLSERLLTLIPATDLTPFTDAPMKPLLQQPLFLRTVARVQRARRVGAVIVVTTIHEDDDAIARACWRTQTPYFRGAPSDRLDRLYRAARRYDAEAVVVIPGDGPLIDPVIIDRVLDCFWQEAAHIDYVSNLEPPSYPAGNDVEVVSMAALEAVWRHGWGLGRDQIAPLLRAHSGRFRLHHASWKELPAAVRAQRWTATDVAGYRFVRAVYRALFAEKPDFTLADILALLQRQPALSPPLRDADPSPALPAVLFGGLQPAAETVL